MATSVGNRVGPSLLTVGDAAKLLHVHTNTIRRWESQGLLRAWRVGPRHDRRFLKVEVLYLLHRQQPFTADGERKNALRTMAG